MDDGRRIPSPDMTRRQVLAGAGVAAIGALAGCSTADGVAHSRDVFGHSFPYGTENVQLNPWVSASYPWGFHTMIFETLSVSRPGEPREPGDIVADFSIDGRTATLSFRTGFTWWNGEPVTARDQFVGERISAALGDGDGPAVELADEYTLVYEFDRALDEELVQAAVLDGAVNTPAWQFGEWADRLEAADSATARERVLEDVQSTTISLDDAMERGLGCGPYELSEVAMNRVMLEAYDDHPRADAIEIPRLWFPVSGSVSTDALVSAGEVDGGSGVISRLRHTPPAAIEQLVEFRTNTVTKLALAWHNDHLARRGVRRAILARLPLRDVVGDGVLGEASTAQTGLGVPAERRWLAEDTLDALHEYPVDADPERAAAHMRDAGYERDGDGNWRGPDGRPVTFRLRSPTWQDWGASAMLVYKSLDGFGFDVHYQSIPDPRLVEDVRSRNYDAMLWPSTGRPHTVYDVTSTWPGTIAYGVSDPDAETGVHEKPITVDVPRPAGGTETVNLVELWRRLSGRSDRATTREAIGTVARWWSHSVPDIELGTGVSGTWGNTRDFTWPAEPATYRTAGPEGHPVYHALKHGFIGQREA